MTSPNDPHTPPDASLPQGVEKLKPIVSWAIRHWASKMKPDELADAILSSPQMQDALQPRAAAAVESAGTVSIEALDRRETVMIEDDGFKKPKVVIVFDDRASADRALDELEAILAHLQPDAGAMDVEALRKRVAELEVENAALRTDKPDGDAGLILAAFTASKWPTHAIVERFPSLPPKRIYNAIGYLVRLGWAARLSYGTVEIYASRTALDGAGNGGERG